MTEEKKRYSRYKDWDCPVYDESEKGMLHIVYVIDRLNAYESRVKELEHAITRYQQGSRVLMPSELTAEKGAKDLLMGEFFEESKQDCPECYGDGCDDCSGVGSQAVRIPVSWSTIKQIYSVCVSNLSVDVK